MYACVLQLRQMGVLLRGQRPPETRWARGIFEVTDNLFAGLPPGRRLVLRDSRSSPGMGLLMALYQPMLVDANDTHLRFRGIEGVAVGDDEIGGMVQEWLVRLL